MTPIEALHTAARRYCVARSALWHERYAQSGVDANSDEARRICPRYHVLEAVLTAVEATVPEDFGSLEEEQKALILAGQTAQNCATRLPAHREGVAHQAMDEERASFCKHLFEFATLAAMPGWSDHVKPIPHRRTLGVRESAVLWERLAERWQIHDHYWYPLAGDAHTRFAVLAVWADDFNAQVPLVAFQGLFRDCGVRRVWNFHELAPGEPDCEIDLVLMEPFYGPSEQFWTSAEMDWLVYASHEGTLTFAGEWLVSALKARWPDWSAYTVDW
jgi:hypothetical protein